MADKIDLKLGENTPEGVALKLLQQINYIEKLDTREKILDAFAECHATVLNPHGRLKEKKDRR